MLEDVTVTRDALIFYAKRFVYDFEIAEDLVQELYIILLTKYPDKKVEKPNAFAYRCLRNLCIDYLRSISVGCRDYKKAVEFDERLHGDCYSIEDENIQVEITTKINTTLNTMLIDRKQILYLFLYYGYTHNEISLKLGIAKGTVKSNIYIEALDVCVN